MPGEPSPTPRTADLHILTGAPGTGKTAILDQLAGVHVVREPAREILTEQRAVGGAGTWDRDPSRFVDLLLQRSIEKRDAARRLDGPVVFDRGIPDCVVYASLFEVDPTPSLRASERYRYHGEVLMLEPWEEIYTTDDERRMSFADTIAFQEAIRDAYTQAGYVLVDVPRAPLAQRATFVRDFLTDR
jgi:predicted ATPase